MRGIRSRGITLAIALVIAAGVYVASMPTTEAVVIAGPYVCSYYSSAKFTKVVGARGSGCCGEVISWGTTTSYVRCERLYCLDVLCPF